MIFAGFRVGSSPPIPEVRSGTKRAGGHRAGSVYGPGVESWSSVATPPSSPSSPSSPAPSAPTAQPIPAWSIAPGMPSPTTCKGQRPDPCHRPPLHRIDPQGDHGDRHRIRTDNTAAAPTVSIGPSALPSMCTNGPGALPQAGIRRAFGPRDSASAPSLWPSSGNRPHRASHTVPSSISRMLYHLSLPHLQNDRLPGQAR